MKICSFENKAFFTKLMKLTAYDYRMELQQWLSVNFIFTKELRLCRVKSFQQNYLLSAASLKLLRKAPFRLDIGLYPEYTIGKEILKIVDSLNPHVM